MSRALIAAAVVLLSTNAAARPRDELRQERSVQPDGIHVVDGSYVLDYGELHVNITNHGLIGSQFTETLPFSSAPSGEWPGGSGNEYLWGAGLWIGGRIAGQLGVTTGQPERELRPERDITATIYEARNGEVIRPYPSGTVAGRRIPDPRADDDGDGSIDEDSLNGRDDDGDGRIDEDFGQLASQMFTCTMRDDLQLVQELYPDHRPLGLKVVQRAGAWQQEDYENIVIFEWEITNAGLDMITDVHVGIYVDCDIQRRSDAPQPDDLAGYFDGAGRADNGVFHHLNVGWMRDGNPVDPLPGWFGTVLLGHDTDFHDYYAPKQVGVSTFRIFATNAAVIQHGEPLNDFDRYAVMASRRIDRDQPLDRKGDLKYLMSWGPFDHLPPGRTLTCQAAFVIGSTKDEMLGNALKAAEIFHGREYNLNNDVYFAGVYGRERMACKRDYPPYPSGGDPIYSYHMDIADDTCTGEVRSMSYLLVNDDYMFTTEDGRRCIYINADNCEECFRAMGQECTVENGLFWRFLELYPWYVSGNSNLYTGTYNRETRVRWVFPGHQPPRSPHARLIPGDGRVEILWDDVSEYDLDPETGVVDFESYRIYRVMDFIKPPGTGEATNPQQSAWTMIDEYDVVNEGVGITPGGTATLPLGRNTGLEIARYVPRCLGDPRFDGLAGHMRALVEADTHGRLSRMPALRDAFGAAVPGLEAFIPWETHHDVLDTFFAVTPRAADPDLGIVPKRAVVYYHHLDTEVHNGFETWYAVAPTDHTLSWDDDLGEYVITGEGIVADPGNNFQITTPGPAPQTAVQRERDGVNIYVYPNPATRAALAEMQQKPPHGDDPTGVRVVFTNLPQARNTIKIFTASGEWVQTIMHDGRNGVGATSWNLMSRNDQEVVSGIYLYAVQSDDNRFADFQGRFVVIR